MIRTTPMKRTALVRKTAPTGEQKPVPGPKQRKCCVKACRTPFLPSAPFILWCGPECAVIVAMERVAKQKAKAARAERADTKKKLDAFKSIPHLKAELQTIFNEFIRLRDAELTCICCDKWPTGGSALTGGQWDAAHWKSRGSADHLRFNEDNVHKALKDCNKYGHTAYREGLVRKIGLARVEALEADHAVVKWTREWLEAKKVEYRAKIKQLKEQAA